MKKMRPSINVTAIWDDEARVWVATSDDVPGLVAEADSREGLVEKLNYLIPELLALNAPRRRNKDIPYRLRQESVIIAHA